MRDPRQWCSQGGVKLHPSLSDPGGSFSIRTIRYHSLSLSELNENKQCKSFGGPMPGLQGSLLVLMGPVRGSRGPILGPRGSHESEAGGKLLVFILRKGPARPGGNFLANFTPVTRALVAPLIPELEYFLRDLSHAFFHRYAPFVGGILLHLLQTNHE